MPGTLDLTAETFKDFLAHFPPVYQKTVFKKLEKGQGRILAAAGQVPTTPLEITSQDQLDDDDRFQEMSDPHTSDTRSEFESISVENPIIAKALENRADAFFSDGFHLELELKAARDETTGQLLDDANKQARLAKEMPTYAKFLSQLEAWADDSNIMILERMRSAEIVSFVQGRSLTMMFPAIKQLPQGTLPISVKNISWEDTAGPIIDLQFWTLAGVRVENLEPIKIALPDQFVYVKQNDHGLKKESAYYGTASMAPILQPAKIFKKIINFDFAKAVVAAYMTKLWATAPVDGMDATVRESYLQNLANKLAYSSDIAVFQQGITFQFGGVKVDTEMLHTIYKELRDLLAGCAGATKTQLGITEGLTRDNATIQEIAFIKYVRDPAEKDIKTAFETQLFTPLLAHLSGKKVNELPVKIVVVRNPPKAAVEEQGEKVFGFEEQGTESLETETKDPLMQKKAKEMDDAEMESTDQAMMQDDAKSKPFGAAGDSLDERAVRAMEKIAGIKPSA